MSKSIDEKIRDTCGQSTLSILYRLQGGDPEAQYQDWKSELYSQVIDISSKIKDFTEEEVKTFVHRFPHIASILTYIDTGFYQQVLNIVEFTPHDFSGILKVRKLDIPEFSEPYLSYFSSKVACHEAEDLFEKSSVQDLICFLEGVGLVKLFMGRPYILTTSTFVTSGFIIFPRTYLALDNSSADYLRKLFLTNSNLYIKLQDFEQINFWIDRGAGFDIADLTRICNKIKVIKDSINILQLRQEALNRIFEPYNKG